MSNFNGVNSLFPGSVDGVNRHLIANDGTTIKVDYSNPVSTAFNSTSGTELAIGQGAAPVINNLEIVGAPTANSPLINAKGGDANVDITLQTKGAGNVDFTSTGPGTLLLLQNQASAVNNWTMSVATATNAPVLSVGGGDTNISMQLQAKGTGVIYSGNPISAIAGLRVSTAANSKMGTAVLVGGTVTVANTSVTANSLIFLSRQTAGGTLGQLSITKTAGVGFVITSNSVTDTSTIAFLIMEPS